MILIDIFFDIQFWLIRKYDLTWLKPFQIFDCLFWRSGWILLIISGLEQVQNTWFWLQVQIHSILSRSRSFSSNMNLLNKVGYLMDLQSTSRVIEPLTKIRVTWNNTDMHTKESSQQNKFSLFVSLISLTYMPVLFWVTFVISNITFQY